MSSRINAMKNPMDIFNSSYYRLNKFVLSCLGFWPYQNSISRIVCYVAVIFGTISFSIPQIAYLIKNRHDIDKLYNALPMSFAMIILILKVWVMTYSLTDLKIILDQIQNDWITFTGREKEILERYAENGRKITIYYLVYVTAPTVCYVLWPLSMPILDFVLPLNRSRPRYLIHPAEYFVDNDKYYYIILLNEYFAYAVGSAVAVGADTMYFLFMEHAYGMFAILCYRLENIWTGNETINCQYPETSKEIIYHRITNCIQLHGKILKYLKSLLATYTLYLLCDIGSGLLTHSTICVIVMINTDNPARVLRFATVMCAQSGRLFLNSWPGQKLIDNSSHIYIAAYNASWYKWPTKARKMWSFFIMRNQMPCTISITNLYVVRFESFGMIIKTSLSYCMVMASLH